MEFIVDDEGIQGGKAGKSRKTTGNSASSGGIPTGAGMKGAQRAARLLLALGPEQAAQVLKELDTPAIESLVNEMSQIKQIGPDEKKEILKDFNSSLEEFEPLVEGGLDAARAILNRSMGTDQAEEILNRVTRRDMEVDFEFLEQIDPSLLASTLGTEHPQTAAVALSYIKPRKAAMVIKLMEPAVQSQVAIRIAKTTRTHPDAVMRIAQVLREKFERKNEEIYSDTGGAESLANILNHMDRSTEDILLNDLGDKAPEIMNDVRELLFTFEELGNLDLKEMRLLLSKIEDDYTLAAALRGAGEELRRHFFNGLSQNRAADILEEMDYRGPISVKEINEARTAILNIARKLDDEDMVVIKKEKEEYI